jgi:hypothetical protein
MNMFQKTIALLETLIFKEYYTLIKVYTNMESVSTVQTLFICSMIELL